MLSQLTIDNYALIDNSKVEFQPGFTVITGETGAGKSIMLDALGLVMGARADIKAMGDKTRKTVVEAIFSKPDPGLSTLCENLGIEWDENEIVLRREIMPSGKSRSFVNDTPVNLTALSSLSSGLLDIHSQHSNTALLNGSRQVEILDKFAGSEKILDDYKELFGRYVALRAKIKRHKENRQKAKEKHEFILFRLEHLDKLKPKRGELSRLEKEFEILSDADRIKSSLNTAYALIEGNSTSAVKLLNGAASTLGNIDLSFMGEKNEDSLESRIESLKIELRDISDTILNYIEHIDSDPEKYEKTKDRIGKIEEAIKRFKVKDDDELVDLYDNLREELKTLDDDSIDFQAWEKELKGIGQQLKQQADLLSQSREKGATIFSELLMDRLKPLGLPNIRFEVEFNRGKLTSEGQDVVSFCCSFNKNHKLQPIAEIASGGEISRVMLGIKYLMAEKEQLPTVIFDEIDSGVSGEIAYRMGKMMKEMSAAIQVIAVTHLPQVAASGANHFRVYKSDDASKTISHVKTLDREERIREIAGMLSGSEINETAIRNAEALIESL